MRKSTHKPHEIKRTTVFKMGHDDLPGYHDKDENEYEDLEESVGADTLGATRVLSLGVARESGGAALLAVLPSHRHMATRTGGNSTSTVSAHAPRFREKSQ